VTGIETWNSGSAGIRPDGFRESHFPDPWRSVKESIEELKRRFEPGQVLTLPGIRALICGEHARTHGMDPRVTLMVGQYFVANTGGCG
jgi:hypothetical protein